MNSSFARGVAPDCNSSFADLVSAGSCNVLGGLYSAGVPVGDRTVGEDDRSIRKTVRRTLSELITQRSDDVQRTVAGDTSHPPPTGDRERRTGIRCVFHGRWMEAIADSTEKKDISSRSLDS